MNIRSLLAVGAIAAAAQFSTTSLTAQSAPVVLDVDSVPASVRGLVIEAQGELTTLDGYGRAARLYHTAAERLGDDPEAPALFATAARLAYYAGSERRAMWDLQRAGEGALAWGDVVTAARSFLDGAWVAAEIGEYEAARLMVARAEKLAASPLLAAADRTLLASRLTEIQQ